MSHNKALSYREKIENWRRVNQPVFDEWNRKICKYFEDNPEVKSITCTIGDSAPITICR